MTYRHHRDRDGSCSEMGQTAETSFKNSLEAFSFELTATEFKDQIRHLDFFVDSPEGLSVDVKARKRVARSGERQDELVWVEFVGGGGKKGWLYGEQDWLAFEREKDFVVVPRSNLAELCEKVVDTETPATSASDAVLKMYNRKGKKDALSLIPMKTITKNIPVIILKKYE